MRLGSLSIFLIRSPVVETSSLNSSGLFELMNVADPYSVFQERIKHRKPLPEIEHIQGLFF